jgi:hypothetical protein
MATLDLSSRKETEPSRVGTAVEEDTFSCPDAVLSYFDLIHNQAFVMGQCQCQWKAERELYIVVCQYAYMQPVMRG